jgi:hypothetical protein
VLSNPNRRISQWWAKPAASSSALLDTRQCSLSSAADSMLDHAHQAGVLERTFSILRWVSALLQPQPQRLQIDVFPAAALLKGLPTQLCNPGPM